MAGQLAHHSARPAVTVGVPVDLHGDEEPRHAAVEVDDHYAGVRRTA